MSEHLLPDDTYEIQALAKRVLEQEAGALTALKLDPRLLQEALRGILECKGVVMVVGAGTSSSIARRLAHLLTCSGARAFYLDPGQAQHGYAAIITEHDVLIAFSRGGDTDEVNHTLRVARKRGARIIAITEAPESTMAKMSDIVFVAHVAPENDAGGVIPLASTLAHAAVGDILCAGVLAVRGYEDKEFGELHPGGAVGKRFGLADQQVEEGKTEPSGRQPSLRELRGLLVDMDGTLWQGDTPLPGLVKFFEVSRRYGIQIMLASNNPSQTPEVFAQKARRMGVEVDPDQIVTSVIATVHYLSQHFAPGTRLHVVGNPPIKQLIQDAGFVIADEDVAAVVVSLDRSLTYETLKRATLLIRGGAEFLGTNGDASYPSEEGILPGSGTVVAALAASTDSQPTIIGKPERWVFDLALNRMGLSPAEVASVGDRLDTDIAGGARAGLKTILVLSGIATPGSLAASPIQPTWVFKDLNELAQALVEAWGGKV